MSNNFFKKEAETASLDSIRNHQLEKLKLITNHVYSSNAAYKKLFDAKGVHPKDIKTLDDIVKLPFTNKDAFRESYPINLCCVEKNQLAEMHMSSGSTGTPVVMPYTLADIGQWADCMARCYYMAGAEKGDTVQITPSFGLFNGGFGMYHGARAAELFIVPTGAGNTQRQIKLAKDFKTKVLTGVVSYGIRIMEVMEEMKEKLPDLKIGIFGAEIFSESIRKKIEAGLGIETFDIYGMTETGGVGTLGMDCCARSGIHIWEDHYYIEVLDKETNKPVQDGQFGELTITSLTRQALPVIRFRTGDLSKIISREKCSCGRTHVRIAPITGRVDDMLIVKGVNFFPRQVEQALLQIPGVGSNYQIIMEEIDGVQDVRINVEADSSVTGYTVEKVLKETLGFSPKGDVFPIGGLPRQEGKAQRVFYKK
ncbi:MAG: phenylacetate--CoA ligase [Planctomycetes bacterium GWF2_42_9]|nr:MAG: phenylacetate--CoA ligase [Planctomycetes bacterium GWF2_42_9]HAL44427.1 phenylacetate--CoA ligase [Phycisphaerales bacterium]